MRNKNWIEFNNNNIKNGDIKDKVFKGQSKKIKSCPTASAAAALRGRE